MNLNQFLETIVAIATPPGRGGIGVIRISGALCSSIAQHMLGLVPKPRFAQYASFKDSQGDTIDQGIALYFPSPHSFTGEDVLELQGHGGRIVQDSLLSCILALGARLARPGEFSERAFLNGKLDLTQAEAIADLIDSASKQAARAAMASLQGAFSDAIEKIVSDLIALRVLVEASIDFSDEAIDFLPTDQLKSQLLSLIEQVNVVLDRAQQGALLREGMTVVIAGCPNVGKSSLLNRLTERQSAIVSDIPGTTRDVLREQLQMDGLPLHVIDTAGLHESSDPIEQEGMQRARNEIAHADQMLWVVDTAWGVNQPIHTSWSDKIGIPDSKKLTVVRNKIDLTGDLPQIVSENGYFSITLSAKTGEGMDLLKQHLKQIMGFNVSSEGKFIARRRHLDALKRASDRLEDACTQLSPNYAPELLAESLRQAQLALDEITGKFTADDLLGKVFSSFCIGK